MPSNSKLFLKPFIGGLNTETTDVEDMLLNTSEELNCTILPEAMRGRRYGFNIERDGEWEYDGINTRSFSGYLWKNVNKTSENLIVVQVNTLLKFYQASTKPITQIENNGKPIKKVGSVDISAYAISDTSDGIGPLNYAIGDGLLYIVNRNIKPLQIKYAPTEEENVQNFIVNPYNLYIRDFDGVEDGLDIDEMPISSSTTENIYGGLSNEHHYNLLNQGWDVQDLIDFATAKNKWPSNNLQWFVGKDNSGDFNTEKLLKTYFGNTPAPKGHFIINYFTQNRSEVSAIYGISPRHSHFHYDETWIRNGDLRGVEVKRFRKILNRCENEVLRSVIIKFNSILRRIGHDKELDVWHGDIRVRIYGIKGDSKYNIWKNNTSGKTVLVKENGSEGDTFHRLSDLVFLGYSYQSTGETVKLADETFHTDYGDYRDKTLLYNITFDNEVKYTGGYGIIVDFLNGDNEGHKNDDPTRAPFIVSADIYGYTAGEDTNIFPIMNESNTVTDITYMGNRLFYLVNDTVLFSQAIGNDGKGFEKCYQDADPTSEEVSDIIPTDGGLVKLNNIGVGRALETFNRGVLVFGDNIVYGLISPVEKLFTATEYDIVELSRAGIIGPRSAVSTDDMVYYWSPLGIFRIGINPNTGSSLIAQSITHTTIQTFYNNIPDIAKRYCRGVFDYVANRIYWYYPLSDDYSKLDGCLVYDLTYNSFMPFKIGEADKDIQPAIVDAFQTNLSYEIEPTMYLSAGGNRVVAGGNKVIAAEVNDEEYHRWTAIQHIIAKDQAYTSFGDYNDREFKDFGDTVFDSYMVSKPITVNDTYYNKQAPIMQTLFKRTEEYKLNTDKNIVKIEENLQVDYKSEGPLSYIVWMKPLDCSMYIKDCLFKIDNIVDNLNNTSKTSRNVYVSVKFKDKEGKEQNKYFNTTVKDESGVIIINLPEQLYTDITFSFAFPSVNGVYITSADVSGSVVGYYKSTFESTNYIAASGAYIRMRWGWSLADRSNRWDMIQNAYRPQKDFMYDEFVESRMHIRGRGKAFQVEIRNDENKDMRLAGLNLIIRNP